MRFNKIINRIFLFSVLITSLVACQAVAPGPSQPTPTQVKIATSVPLTDTPMPTLTPTLRPSSTPVPTLTLAPSLTPIPTNTPTPGILGLGFTTGPFRDDFSDPTSGWVTEDGGDWGFGYYEGGYRMYANIGYAEVCSSRSRSHTDFIIEVDVQKLSGPDNAYYGVTCRKTGSNYYSLAITAGGEYRILKTTGGVPVVLAKGASPAIKKGDAVNHLLASCIGNVMTLSVNGVEVGSVSDIGPLFGTFVGLVVGSTTEPNIEVKFDNFDSYPTGNAPAIPSLTPVNNQSPTPTRTPTATP